MEKELGKPVKSPAMKMSYILGIPFSSSLNRIRNFFINSFEPNCNDTWAPTPRRGESEPMLLD